MMRKLNTQFVIKVVLPQLLVGNNGKADDKENQEPKQSTFCYCLVKMEKRLLVTTQVVRMNGFTKSV